MTETRGEAAAREELRASTRIILRPLAGPLALGFFGLAGATFVVAGLQLGWVAPTESRQVALCVLAFTVPLQFTTSIFGFLARDGVAATGMGLLSGIWAAIGLVLLTGTPASTSNALGLFLVIAGIAMWAPASAAAPAKLVPALVLATAGLRFVLTGIYEISGSEIWENTAGVVGLILAALAVYAAYAAEYEDILEAARVVPRATRQGPPGARGHIRPASCSARARARRSAATLRPNVHARRSALAFATAYEFQSLLKYAQT